MRLQHLSRDRMRRQAARWHDAAMSGHTYCLTPGQAPPEAIALPEAILAAIRGSETGAVLFWSQAESHLVLPPFPIERAADYPGWHVGPLQSLLDRPRTIAVLLLRLGGLAVGVFEGKRLLSSKAGGAFVKGRHRKGGSSSARFARRREGQVRQLFDKACRTFQGVVEPYHDRLDHLVLGGDRRTLQAFERRCPYLNAFTSIRLQRVLDVPDPRLKVLEGAGRLLYTSRVFSFRPEQNIA